jgi:hypothetical protein
MQARNKAIQQKYTGIRMRVAELPLSFKKLHTSQ